MMKNIPMKVYEMWSSCNYDRFQNFLMTKKVLLQIKTKIIANNHIEMSNSIIIITNKILPLSSIKIYGYVNSKNFYK